MNQFLVLSCLAAVAYSAVVLPEPAKCNVQGGNSRKARLEAEKFCNDPAADSSGHPLLKKFANKWTWSYLPQTHSCHRHKIVYNGTDQIYTDVKGNVEWVYIEVKETIYRDQPAQWRCANVSTNFYPLDSNPDHNVLVQIECLPGGYEYYIYIQDYVKLTKADRDELVANYGFDLSRMDEACAKLTAPES